jgi:hypothetical protein
MLRAPQSARLIAVLNGEDEALERLWQRERVVLLQNMKGLGIHAITGPTYSIYSEGPTHPAAHNVAMLGRHHRFCADASAAGLIAIPNIYFRNRREALRWGRHLAESAETRIISRDFTRTKSQSGFIQEFESFLHVLRAAGRPMHVVLQGIGIKKIAFVARELAKVEATFTLMTAKPIVEPIVAGRTRLQTISDFVARVESAATDAIAAVKVA